MTAPHSFGPHERIRCSADFQRVKMAGKRTKSYHFGLNFLPNGLEHHRLGLIVQKRFWPEAVWRNRIKRVIREWFRLYKGEIPRPAKDIVVIARQGAEKLSPEELRREFSRVFQGQENGR
ncbi:MAG: ribonuclease P protein component [Syntrophobacteraceae bacterium]|nr:ribonuclease P protein component [Syntrophobacteraceae bacterium]